MTRAWPRFGISAISVTPSLRACRLLDVEEGLGDDPRSAPLLGKDRRCDREVPADGVTRDRDPRRVETVLGAVGGDPFQYCDDCSCAVGYLASGERS